MIRGFSKAFLARFKDVAVAALDPDNLGNVFHPILGFLQTERTIGRIIADFAFVDPVVQGRIRLPNPPKINISRHE